MTTLEVFLRVSWDLTGEAALEESLASSFYNRLSEVYPTEMARLIKQYPEDLATGLEFKAIIPRVQAQYYQETGHDSMTQLMRNIIWVWYTGQFIDPDEADDPPHTVEEYKKGLLWGIIKAHAPGFTNAGYGVWANLPPN